MTDPAASSPSPVSPRFNLLRWLIAKIGLNMVTVIAALILASALFIAYKGKDLYQGVQHYRASKLAREAHDLITAERWEMASQMLQNGIRSMPDQPPLLREVADLFARGYNDPQTAAAFLRRVISHSEGTAQDRRRLAEILLQAGDLNEARRIYAELPAAEQTTRKGLELLSAITRAAGNASESDQLMRRALMLDPGDKDARLRLAIMDEAQALDDARSTIAQTIWTIASAGDETALKAIEHLAVSKSLTAVQAKDLVALVERTPKSTERVRYAALHAQLKLSPLEHDRIVAHEIQRNKGKSPDNMFDFLRWLGQQGEYQKILDIVPAESVSRDADVFLIYVDALSSSERWKELLNLMTTRRAPITQATAHVILAQCHARLQPDLKEARRQLSAAFATGRKEVPVIMRGAALAEALHLYDLAMEGYKAIAESRPPLRLQLLEKILELQRASRDTEGMMQTLLRLRDLRPRNRTYADQINYLRLITGTEIELAYDQLIRLNTPEQADDSPESSIPASLLRALAALRVGDMKRMKDETAKLSSVHLLPAGMKAATSGLLTLSGRDVEGYRLGEKILHAGLLDQELQLLRRAMSN